MQVLTSNNNDEWYTPPFIIEEAKKFFASVRNDNELTEIDLDAASNSVAQSWIGARAFYCLSTDGSILLRDGNNHHVIRSQHDRFLMHDDHPIAYKPHDDHEIKTVWLNPPYKHTQQFIDAMIYNVVWHKFDHGLLLVNAALGYGWFENLYRSFPTCLIRNRVPFIDQDHARYIYDHIPDNKTPEQLSNEYINRRKAIRASLSQKDRAAFRVGNEPAKKAQALVYIRRRDTGHTTSCTVPMTNDMLFKRYFSSYGRVLMPESHEESQ